MQNYYKMKKNKFLKSLLSEW